MKFRVGAILAGVTMMVAVASPTYAQGTIVGAKVGINFADISGDDDAEDEGVAEKMKLGFVAGGFIEVPVTPQFSFAPEVLVTQKGTKFEDELSDATFSVNLTQVQVPVLFKANFSEGSVRPFVLVGPAFGFTASAKTKFETGSIEEETDLDDTVEPVEFSLVFGGGVRFGQASLEARYDLGLNDMEKSADEGKTRTFSILFGFGWSN
jgi:hypothetical protein